MATTKKETATEEEAKTVEKKPAAVKGAVKTESEYTAQELAQNAEKIFNTRSECVAAALKTANVAKCSISKAKEIVKAFMTKEVK